MASMRWRYGNDFLEISDGCYKVESICSLCPAGLYSPGGAMSGPIEESSFKTNYIACNSLSNEEHVSYGTSVINVSPECACQCTSSEYAIIVPGHI